MRKSHMPLTRLVVVAILSVAGASLGAWSAWAGQPVTYHLRGGTMFMDWYNGSNNAHLGLSNDTRSPRQGDVVNWGYAAAHQESWDNTWTSSDVQTVGDGDGIGGSGGVFHIPATITIDRFVKSASASGTIPAVETFWDWNAWQTGSGPTTLTFNADLVGGDEISRGHHTYRHSSATMRYRYYFTGIDNPNPTGTMSLSSSLTGAIYVPAGSAITDGDINYHENDGWSTLTLN